MNKSNPTGLLTGSDTIDAKIEEHQLCGSKKCPSCGHKLEGKPDWVGLPAGVKFDPTDQELIEHLEAKVLAKDIKSHPLIDEFIPTIEGEDGICYTHPEKLPGVTRDGLSRHFFHRPSKAYTTGTRKRRKIQTESDNNTQGGSSSSSSGETRWHKTGKTRPVNVNGIQKGCKKILVLYTNFGKNRKPEKTNWVMHQYHLGTYEEEKEGELVVSKIFYQTQPRQCNWSSSSTSSLNVVSGGGGEGSSGGGGGEYNIRRDNGGICSSSREIINVNPLNRSGDIGGGVGGGVMAAAAAAVAAGLPSYAIDQLSFVPFMKGFDEVTRRENPPTGQGTCEDVMTEQHRHHHHSQQTSSPSPSHHVAHDHNYHHHQHHQQQQQRHHAFNICQPTHPISTIISPSTSLHHASINILEDNPYHVQRILLPNANYQTQQQEGEEEHNDGKMGRRSASGLEELIMGCTSSTTHHDVKDGQSSMGNQQEAEWLKYSTFWQAPDSSDNQDHHG